MTFISGTMNKGNQLSTEVTKFRESPMKIQQRRNNENLSTNK